MAAALGGPLPATGSDPVAVIDRLARAAEPGLANSPGPRYFGWVMGGSVEAATAADTLAVAWDQVAGMQVMSPAAAAAEEVAGAWLIELLGLPEGRLVRLRDGRADGELHRLWRRRGTPCCSAPAGTSSAAGCRARRRCACSRASSRTRRSTWRCGTSGSGAPRQIPVDVEGRIRPEALAEALADGDGPAIVCAQAGDVNSGAFDPFGEIADICATHDAWLHVDGAFGLWAAASPSLRHLVADVDRADSWATDCHKWLNVPYDSRGRVRRATPRRMRPR